MKEESTDYQSPFILRRLREFLYVIVGFPITLVLSAILIAAFSTGVSTVIFLPIAALMLLALLAAMEYVAKFEIARTNRLLKSDIGLPSTPWFTHPFFSWDGAKERVASGRSWLAILYIFIACALSLLVFLPAVAALGFIVIWLSTSNMFAFHSWYHDFHINKDEFGGNILFNLDPHQLHVQALGSNIDGKLADSQFTWVFHSTTTVAIAGVLILLILFTTPFVAKWQKSTVIRFLSSQSFAEKLYTSGVRLKKAVSIGTQDRNRIEKDLHDGVQARLTVTGIEIGRAQLLADKAENREISDALTRAAAENAAAMQEIRNLVRGLRPALLEKNGLEAALKSLAEKNELDMKIEVIGDRFDSDIESAIYLICSEAIMNVMRHSRATTMSINIMKKERIISLEIQDDGVGGADETKGNGMRNMQDRVSILGGDLIVFSPEGGPTIIKAVIPCE